MNPNQLNPFGNAFVPIQFTVPPGIPQVPGMNPAQFPLLFPPSPFLMQPNMSNLVQMLTSQPPPQFMVPSPTTVGDGTLAANARISPASTPPVRYSNNAHNGFGQKRRASTANLSQIGQSKRSRSLGTPEPPITARNSTPIGPSPLSVQTMPPVHIPPPLITTTACGSMPGSAAIFFQHYQQYSPTGTPPPLPPSHSQSQAPAYMENRIEEKEMMLRSQLERETAFRKQHEQIEMSREEIQRLPKAFLPKRNQESKRNRRNSNENEEKSNEEENDESNRRNFSKKQPKLKQNQKLKKKRILTGFGRNVFNRRQSQNFLGSQRKSRNWKRNTSDSEETESSRSRTNSLSPKKKSSVAGCFPESESVPEPEHSPDQPPVPPPLPAEPANRPPPPPPNANAEATIRKEKSDGEISDDGESTSSASLKSEDLRDLPSDISDTGLQEILRDEFDVG